MTRVLLVEYCALFITCLFFSLLLNFIFLRFIKNLGIRNKEETIIRWSSKSKPAIGGISFYIIFLISIIVYSLYYEKSINFINLQLIGILFISTLGFLLGFFDDAYNTKPLIKLFTQITCGIILISTNVYIHFFDYEILNYALTIFWVVGIMNSINMLDNMDAITSIISIFIILTVIITQFIIGNYINPDLFILIGILAAVLGFLKYNWSPSIIYMGDTGSQFLGAFLAAIGIIYLWNRPEVSGIEIWSKQIITCVLIFSIPIIDTTVVVIKRLMKKKSPFIGGKDHTTHHISYLGFSDKQVAYIYSAISFITMVLAIIAINFINNWSYLHIILYAVYILGLFISLFYIALLNVK